MQRPAQADVDQVYRGFSDRGVWVGGGGEPEPAADLGQLLRSPAEHDHLGHVGPLGVDDRVGLAKPGAQQRDLYRG